MHIIHNLRATIETIKLKISRDAVIDSRNARNAIIMGAILLGCLLIFHLLLRNTQYTTIKRSATDIQH